MKASRFPAAVPTPPPHMLEPPQTSPEPPPEPASPADLTPAPKRRERAAWYAGAMLLACAIATVGMQLWNRDLHAPFYYDLDSMLYLPLVKTTLEHGGHWHTERLGAPGQQELYDFPIIDYLHLGILWLIGRVVPDLLLVYNLYSLLTYPLTVLTAMWVLRWLKLSLPAAAVGGLLYAFLPYHQERYHYHYFLAAYWWVPVSLVPALAILKGDFPFFAKRPDGTRGWNLWSRRALWTVLFGMVTASAGAYYAFFACAAYAFSGVYAWAVYRTWRGAAAAALTITPVVAVGYAYHLPTFAYQAKYGSNPITQRYPEEAESYGLKLAHVLLPANDHNFRPFSTLRSQYSSPMRPADGESAGSFGIIGGVGLLALLALAVLPHRRRWPEGGLVALTVFLVLLGTIGAFGSLFNLLVTPQIRAYNRLGIFIAFLSFFMVLWWIDRFLLTRTGRRMKQLRYPALAALLAFGCFDQTPWGWNPLNPNGMEKIDAFAERFRADKRFFHQIEAAMPDGAAVFCLPYMSFPESRPVHKMPTYEHARGYVMTDTLAWSFGAMKRREADAWQRDVSFGKPDEMLRRVVARGFDGVLIDGRGFPATRDVDRAAVLINRLNELYGGLQGVPRTARLPEIIHEDGKQFFLDLRPYREAYQRTNPAGYAQSVAEETAWVAPLWLGGFYVTEPDGGEQLYWGPFDADLVLVNPTDRTRTFDLSFIIGVEVAGPFDVTISPPLNDSFTLEKITDKNEPQDLQRLGVPKRYALDLPPGRTTIHFRCRPPAYFLPLDRRNLCFFIKDFKLVEHR